MKTRNILLFIATLTGSVFLHTGAVSALSGSEFQAGRIIDDGVFFNGSSLSSGEIQGFLSSKVPTCDTNGTQMRGSVTRAAYGTSQGYTPPYTCLKDYRQDTPSKPAETGLCDSYTGGNRSAAEIIYEVGKSCGISQRALIVLLQKEQSLVADDWPWSIQYRSATGYGCPDTAPCDAEYYGFFNQVYNAARQFKRYARDSSQFSYRAFRNNYVQYNPNAACGGSNIYIENQATAGLYNYTPYQPNPSALNDLYGTGDSCGAYGNRNFWRLYKDWFGSTSSNEYYWRVIRTASDGRLYLQVGNTKRWIPTGEIYLAWNLNQYSTSIVSDSELNSIPTIPELTRLGTTGQYNYVVDNGVKHYIPNNLLGVWNFQNSIAAPVSTLLSTLPEYEPMGRFAIDSAGKYWLMDGFIRHLVSAQDSSSWGRNSTNLVGLTDSYLGSVAVGSQVERNISVAGTTFVVDRGGLIRMPDAVTSSAWAVSPYVVIGSQAISQMNITANGSYLVRASNSPNWYLLDSGSKYYIPNSNISSNWGVNSNSLMDISPELIGRFTSGTTLSNIVKDASNQKVYLLDGNKHYVLNGALLSTIGGSTPNIITTTTARLSQVPDGPTYSKPLVNISGTPHLYLFDDGTRYHVSTGALSAAFDSWGGALKLSSTFVNDLPYASKPLKSVFRDSSNSTYLVDGGGKKSVDSSVISAWQSSQAPTFSDSLRDLISNFSGTISSRYLRTLDTTFIVDAGQKIKVNPSAIASYPGSNVAVNQVNDTLTSSPIQASYLLRSIDDQKVWFINKSYKTEVNFPAQLTLGYLTTSLQPAPVTNVFLSTITTNTGGMSLLIKKQGNGGVKFLNFGASLGFPNSDTLVNSISTSNPIITVDDYIFDGLPLNGAITRILKDDQGKIYLLDNGTKRWITNGNAYAPYRNIPVTYLYGTTMALIPDGNAIN